MEKSNILSGQGGLNGKEQYVPILDESTTADAQKTAAYLNALKAYLITGKKTEESMPVELVPIPLAMQQSKLRPNTDYPILYDSAKDGFISLYQAFQGLAGAYFDEESSAIILDALPAILADSRQRIAQNKDEIAIAELLEAVMNPIRQLDFPQKDTTAFEEKIDAIQQALLNWGNQLFRFSSKTAFQMLNLQLEERAHLKRVFLTALNKVINALEELLRLHENNTNSPDVELDFAAGLIAFDKIKEMEAAAVSSPLSKSGIERLQSALQNLTAFQKSYARETTKVILSQETMTALDLAGLFNNVDVEVSAKPCQQARLQSAAAVEAFVQAVAALKIGQLMSEQKYVEDLHDPYFDQFDLSYLTEDDLQYLHPVILIEEARQLMLQGNDLLPLLSENGFVKIMAVNQLDHLFDIQNKHGQEYLELAALAISRRHSYVFQGSIAWPSPLHASFRKGLDYPGAALWNVLIPSGSYDDAKYLALVAAVASRYFPGIESAGGQINLEQNPEPEAYLSNYKQQVNSPSGVDEISLGGTPAECLALNAQLRKGLEIVPSMYQSNRLIPLQDYLSGLEDIAPGKIPFIWLADEENKLRRAVVPASWIQKCIDRLEYWRFLQSIAGVKNDRLQRSIEEEKAEWAKAKAEEVEALKSAMQKQYEKERSGDLQQAVTRMLYGLLNEQGNIEEVLTKLSIEEPQQDIVEVELQNPAGDQQPAEKPPSVIKEEAWVETEDCTSCKDCVDALPAVFKYNDDRQAYVHNPKGGTFAEIVKAAEKCPARCIHPGLPQNKEEASLDKWVKRAEKYN
jgi:ferredoxin